MHILFLSDNFPPECNAPATRLHEHARRWVAAGHRVTVVTCAPNFPRGRVFDGYRNKLYQRETIDGIDVSSLSLQSAESSGVYRNLQQVDMQKTPFPIPGDHYRGLTCVGVLTYLPDSLGTVREFSRVVKPGGVIVLTHRDDIFLERNFGDVLKQLSDEGVIAQVRISEPRPYLPDHEEFADDILVHYISFSVV